LDTKKLSKIFRKKKREGYILFILKIPFWILS